jgi:hypothetical protein
MTNKAALEILNYCLNWRRNVAMPMAVKPSELEDALTLAIEALKVQAKNEL